MCYINSTVDLNLSSHVGDPIEQGKLLLFTDSDFAGDTRSSKSTTGLFLALVEPRAFAPIAATSKGQLAVSQSSTEAEIIAMEFAVCVESLRVLDFWDAVLPLCRPCQGGRGGCATRSSSAGGRLQQARR